MTVVWFYGDMHHCDAYTVNVCVSYHHLPMVLVLQSKVVSLCQVEMSTDQIKKHLTRGTLLKEKQHNKIHN